MMGEQGPGEEAVAEGAAGEAELVLIDLIGEVGT